ncbi:MAG: cold-shock protein [Desulfobacterales bacterium]|nr:cold-shock protein [Desulfobacterales bacterium]
MIEGSVKWFNDKKGYGFIETDEHGDVFVHYTGIDGDGFRTLNESEKVSLEVEESNKGLQATQVKRL